MLLDSLVIIFWSSAALCFLECATLIYYVVNVELPRKKSSRTFGNTFTVFNSLILVILGSAASLFIIVGLEYATDYPMSDWERFISDLTNTLVALFLGTAELAYITYSWIRSRALIDTASMFARTLRWAIFASPVVFQSSFVLKVAFYSLPVQKRFPFTIIKIMQAAGGALTFIFDAIFLYIFIRYLVSTRRGTVSTVSYTIIAKYGIAGCVSVIGAVIFYASSSLGLNSYHYQLTFAVMHCLNFCGLALFLMKLALDREGRAMKSQPDSTKDTKDLKVQSKNEKP